MQFSEIIVPKDQVIQKQNKFQIISTSTTSALDDENQEMSSSFQTKRDDESNRTLLESNRNTDKNAKQYQSTEDLSKTPEVKSTRKNVDENNNNNNNKVANKSVKINNKKKNQRSSSSAATANSNPSWLQKLKNLSRHGLGIFLIILVAFIWVCSSEFLQFVFGDEHFDKPYFVTYFNTMSFGLWMFGFACPGASGFGRNPWKKIENEDEHDNNNNNNHDNQAQDTKNTIHIENNDSNNNTKQASGEGGKTDSSLSKSSKTRRTVAESTGIAVTPPTMKTEMRDNHGRNGNDDDDDDADEQQNMPPPPAPFAERNTHGVAKKDSQDVNGSDTSSNPNDDKQDEDEDEEEVEVKPYSVFEIAYAAFLFCPLWFFANVLFNYSLSRTSVASNTILSSTSCIWAMLFSRLLLNEEITIQKLVALSFSFGGAFLVGFGDSENNNSSSTVGNILAGVSAMFYAAYTTVLRHCLPDERRYPIGMCFAFVGVFNAILLWPGIILLNYLGVEDFVFPSAQVAGFLILNGLIGTNLSDILWAKSVILTSPVIATLGLSLTIPLSMLADLLFKGKWHSAVYLCGAVGVTLGFVVANWEVKEENREHPRTCCGMKVFGGGGEDESEDEEKDEEPTTTAQE